MQKCGMVVVVGKVKVLGVWWWWEEIKKQNVSWEWKVRRKDLGKC